MWSAVGLGVVRRASVVVDVPVEEAFKMWEDREKIPQWMPWIHSVKVQPGTQLP